ncbi:transposase [Streptomyces sp. JB150]|nr:transposase [Streptomyces sp. JB150]
MRGRLPHPREKEGADTGPSPVDRRKTGSEHHLICDGRGTPLKVITTAANVNDVTRILALVDGIPPVAERRGARAAALTRSSVTRATTPTPTAESCPSGGSCRSSPARAPRASTVRASSATSSSRPSPCSTSSNALPSVGNAEPDSTNAFVSLAGSLICWRRLKKARP